jgi:hypothetical protein
MSAQAEAVLRRAQLAPFTRRGRMVISFLGDGLPPLHVVLDEQASKPEKGSLIARRANGDGSRYTITGLPAAITQIVELGAQVDDPDTDAPTRRRTRVRLATALETRHLTVAEVLS